MDLSLDIMSKKYKVRDLVETKNEFGARIFAVIEITEIGYRAVSIKDKKRYNLIDDQISCKTGILPEDSPLLLVDEYDIQKGKEYCLYQASEFPEEAEKWKALAELKPGDKMQLVHRRMIFKEAVFVAINFKKPLYPIRAKIKGFVHDFKLNSMIFKN
jgi:hypothetical protein